MNTHTVFNILFQLSINEWPYDLINQPCEVVEKILKSESDWDADNVNPSWQRSETCEMEWSHRNSENCFVNCYQCCKCK